MVNTRSGLNTGKPNTKVVKTPKPEVKVKVKVKVPAALVRTRILARLFMYRYTHMYHTKILMCTEHPSGICPKTAAMLRRWDNANTAYQAEVDRYQMDNDREFDFDDWDTPDFRETYRPLVLAYLLRLNYQKQVEECYHAHQCTQCK